MTLCLNLIVFKLNIGDSVILPELLDWCKIFIDKQLNGKVIFKSKCLILNKISRD